MVIDYPLVPMGDYQSILEWSLEAWMWLAGHGPRGRRCNEDHGAPPMFLAGDSSGGGTAFSLLLKLHNNSTLGSTATGYVGESPWLNLAREAPSWDDGAQLRRVARGVGVGVGVGAAYCGARGSCGKAGDDLSDPYASPYWATDQMLLGLPPLYFVTSSPSSPAADSSVDHDVGLFARRAANLGVRVLHDEFSGMWQAFPRWSEGRCAATRPGSLWQGVAALERMGSFVQQVAEQSLACPPEYSGYGNNNAPEIAHTVFPGSVISIMPLEITICPWYATAAIKCRWYVFNIGAAVASGVVLLVLFFGACVRHVQRKQAGLGREFDGTSASARTS